MKRNNKIRSIEKFFETGIFKQETKIVFRTYRNGKPIEPEMTDKEFQIHIENLKKTHNDVFIFVEEKTYLD